MKTRFALMIVLSLVLAACGSPTPEPEPTPLVEPVVTVVESEYTETAWQQFVLVPSEVSVPKNTEFVAAYLSCDLNQGESDRQVVPSPSNPKTVIISEFCHAGTILIIHSKGAGWSIALPIGGEFDIQSESFNQETGIGIRMSHFKGGVANSKVEIGVFQMTSP